MASPLDNEQSIFAFSPPNLFNGLYFAVLHILSQGNPVQYASRGPKRLEIGTGNILSWALECKRAERQPPHKSTCTERRLLSLSASFERSVDHRATSATRLSSHRHSRTHTSSLYQPYLFQDHEFSIGCFQRRPHSAPAPEQAQSLRRGQGGRRAARTGALARTQWPWYVQRRLVCETCACMV